MGSEILIISVYAAIKVLGVHVDPAYSYEG